MKRKYLIVLFIFSFAFIAILVLLLNSKNPNIKTDIIPASYTINSNLKLFLDNSNAFSENQIENNIIEINTEGVQLVVYYRVDPGIFYSPRQRPEFFSIVHISHFKYPVLRVTDTGDIDSKVQSLLKYPIKYYYTNTNGLNSCDKEFGCIDPVVIFKNGQQLYFYCSAKTVDGADTCDWLVENLNINS